MSHARYSIVVPVHNEEPTLPHLHSRLSGLLERLDGEAEVLLVDDGSRDRSYGMMTSIHRLQFGLDAEDRSLGKQKPVGHAKWAPTRFVLRRRARWVKRF